MLEDHVRAELAAIHRRNEMFWDAAAERDCSHPTEAENDRSYLLAVVEDLTKECERHRNANLVRAVLGTTENGDAVAEWVVEVINAESFDRVPWMITESFRDEARRRGEQCIAAIAERDAYKFVLACIATGDCEDPVKLAREILAEGRVSD